MGRPSDLDRTSGPGTRFRRRRLLGVLGAAGLAGIAGCLGDEEDTADDDVTDDPGSDGDDPEQEDDTAADDGTPPGEDDGTNGDRDVDPAELDLGPDDLWGEPHAGIEIPDEESRGVFLIGGERIDGPLFGTVRVFLDGEPGGYVITESEVTSAGLDEGESPENEFRVQGGFTIADPSGENGNADGGQFTVGFTRAVGYRSPLGTLVEWEHVEIVADDRVLGTVQHGRWPDGDVLGGDQDGHTYLEESFVRIDPSGVITSVGEFEGLEDDSLDGPFELGLRLPEELDREA